MSERYTLIQIATRAMEGIGMPAPSSVSVTTSDDNAKQVVQCIYDTAHLMMDDFNWQSLKRLGTFNTLAAESQGSIYTLFADWRGPINDTMWNTTLDRKVYGPVSDQIWREAKTLGRVGVDYKMWRIFGDALYLYEQTTAGEVIHVEYNSTYWILSGGLTRQNTISANSDVCLLHGPTMVAGVQATWLHRNGQASDEAFARFERSLKTQKSKDQGAEVLSLNSPRSKGRRYGPRGDVSVTGY